MALSSILIGYATFVKNVTYHFNKLRELSSDMDQQEGRQVNDDDNDSSAEAEILEQGDIYFFYRPKKAAKEVKGIEDVRRFFMVTAPEEENSNNNNNKSQLYRLFVEMGKIDSDVKKGDLNINN
jgi:hypothetical protein